MRITKLTLKNWGPHESLTLDMDTGVFGLLGPNASGKTNILEGIEFGFTGMLERNQDTYVRKDSSGKQAPNGSVDISFRKGGVEGRVFRQLGTSPRRELHWEGTKYTKVGDIDRLLGEILDCDKRAISLAVFLSQGHIGDFLFENGAKREELFAKMCLIDHLSGVADISAQLGRELATRVTDLTSQRDEALITRDSAEAALKNAETELTLFPDRSLLVKWFQERVQIEDNLFRTLESRQRQLGLVNQAKEQLSALAPVKVPTGIPTVVDGRTYLDYIVSVRGMVENAESTANSLRQLREQNKIQRETLAARSAKRKELASTMPELIGLRGQQTARKAELESYQKWMTAKGAWVKLEKSITSAEEFLEGLRKEREAGPTAAAMNEQEEALRREQLELAPVRLGLKLAREVEAAGQHVSCCPLCRSKDLAGLPSGEELVRQESELRQKDAANTAALVELGKTRAAMVTLDTRIANGITIIKERRQEQAGLEDPSRMLLPWGEDVALSKQNEFDAAQVRLDALEQGAQELSLIGAEITRLENALIGAETDEQMEVKLAALGEQIRSGAEHVDRFQEVDTYLKIRATREKELGEASAALESLTTQVVELEKQQNTSDASRPRDVMLPASAGRSEIAAGLEEVKAKQREREKQQGAIVAHTETLRRTERRVSEIEERIRGNAKIVNVMGDLDQLREAFGRTGIPRHYLSQVFDGLVSGTQENLATWEEDFQVEKDPNNLFNFLFYRGNDPETLLDQSQLSGGQRTRLAISFLQAVQQIVLPEVNFMVLDEPSADLDVDGIEGLGRLFEAMSRSMDDEAQVIVVTHHPSLKTSMGKSVTLEKIA